jgi:hypothetical protein
MWLNQRLGHALSAAAPIGFTNKHLITLDVDICPVDTYMSRWKTKNKNTML